MVIANLLTETVEVKRLETSTGNKLVYDTVIASLGCHIQPVSDRNAQDIEGGFGRDYLLVCDTADIREADHVIWSTIEYRVVGVKHHNFMGEAHTEATIRAFTE